MTSTIPTPSRPATNPPTGALPPIPNTKPKKNPPVASDSPRVASPSKPVSKLRIPSAPSPRPSTEDSASPLAPSLKSDTKNHNTVRKMASASRPLNSSNTDEKSVRRSVSIAAFPQPPKPVGRTSLAPSSSSASNAPTPKSRSPERKPAKGVKSKKAPSAVNGPSSLRSSKPSLLDNSADGKSINGGHASKDSEGRWSIPSPPLSRSSSPQGSATADETSAGSKRGSKVKEGKGNVLVSVRVRPDSANSETSNADGEWLVDGRRTLVSYRGKEGGDYYYDNVFSTHDNNSKVYDSSAKRLVRRVMEGYHGTVFAYGMTGTGKTFSMQGTATSPGVIPLAITDIFSYIRETPQREFLLRVSYLEIYNEKIHDLLSGTGGAAGPNGGQQEEIKLREDSKRGVYATPLKEEIVQSPTQLLRVIARGDHQRRTSSTQFNARSSRSHAVVQIVVESRERVSPNAAQEKRAAISPGGVRVSTLSLIDLAGSERAADNKERRTEGAHINKSLLTLGTVISRLTGDKDKSAPGAAAADGKHLPYRDSKLTRLLQPALSGNSIVSILCTIQIGSGGSAAPANTHTVETLNTLKFAARAKNNIVSHAKRAEESMGNGSGDGGSRVLLERYRMEIQTLRAQLEEQAKSQPEESSTEKPPENDSTSRHEEQILEMQLARTALKERIEHLNRLILSSKSTGVNTSGAMSLVGGMSQLAHSLGGGDTRSLRSSVSQSTLGMGANGHCLTRTASLASVRSMGSTKSLGGGNAASQGQSQGGQAMYDDEDTVGEFGDGIASLQMQVNSLHADLGDKNRYISTLERRLLQARRSSHSRMSVGISHLKGGGGSGGSGGSVGGAGGGPSGEDPDMATVLREKDLEIADLKMQLDDKDRMVAALRSAARQRDIAALAGSPTSAGTPVLATGPDVQSTSHHQSTESNSSSLASGSNANTNATSNSGNGSSTQQAGPTSSNVLQSPVRLNGENKDGEKDNSKEKEKPEVRRRSVDEVSRMLDEMIQDRVENGQIVKGPRGSMQVKDAAAKDKEEGETEAVGDQTSDEKSKALDTVAEQEADVPSK